MKGALGLLAASLAGWTILAGVLGSDSAPRPVEALSAPQPEGVPCQATLDEAVSRLPQGLGTRFEWEVMWDAGGKYYPTTGRATIQAALPCEYVPHVATHEWAHHLQEVSGHNDRSVLVNGVERTELTAECFARLFDAGQGWQWYDSYPERAGVRCVIVTEDVLTLWAIAWQD